MVCYFRFALLVVFTICFYGRVVQSHGYLTDPEPRSINDLAFRMGLINQLPCGGAQWMEPGPVVKEYQAGETYTFTWLPTGNHLGPVSYRVCFDEEVTEECFQRHILGEVPNPTLTNTPISAELKIPEDYECEKCTLSWRWDALYTGEVYSNCADISIVKGNSKKKSKAADNQLPDEEDSDTSKNSSADDKHSVLILVTSGITLAAVVVVIGVLLIVLRVTKGLQFSFRSRDYEVCELGDYQAMPAESS